jgi:membrane-bound lytic murein transglycosylase D
MQQMTSKFAKSTVFTLFLLVAGAANANNEAHFPRPQELERDVDFWISIFTRYTTREGVLHDNRNLAIVYEKIDLPENASRRTRNRLSKERREYYRKILR